MNRLLDEQGRESEFFSGLTGSSGVVDEIICMVDDTVSLPFARVTLGELAFIQSKKPMGQ